MHTLGLSTGHGGGEGLRAGREFIALLPRDDVDLQANCSEAGDLQQLLSMRLETCELGLGRYSCRWYLLAGGL